MELEDMEGLNKRDLGEDELKKDGLVSSSDEESKELLSVQKLEAIGKGSSTISSGLEDPNAVLYQLKI